MGDVSGVIVSTRASYVGTTCVWNNRDGGTAPSQYASDVELRRDGALVAPVVRRTCAQTCPTMSFSVSNDAVRREAISRGCVTVVPQSRTAACPNGGERIMTAGISGGSQHVVASKWVCKTAARMSGRERGQTSASAARTIVVFPR